MGGGGGALVTMIVMICDFSLPGVICSNAMRRLDCWSPVAAGPVCAVTDSSVFPPCNSVTMFCPPAAPPVPECSSLTPTIDQS